MQDPELTKVISFLRDVLGEPLVAVIAGARDVEVVHRWAASTLAPPQDALAALLHASEITRMLLEDAQESPGMIQAFFVGMKPELDDESPALTLRVDPQAILQAARFHMANG